MIIVGDDELEALDFRLRTLLPEPYQETYETIKPVSMGSAPLKYSVHGEVAWDEMWGSFCDLAMAGGPPHKGALLEPAGAAAIDEQPDAFTKVVSEICRGVSLVTFLDAARSPVPGWVRVSCVSPEMAGWLLRAIVMENVSARRDGVALDLPAGPAYRLEKEIKNVVTVLAKTCHYWNGHIPRAQQFEVADVLDELDEKWPLIEPPLATEGDSSDIPLSPPAMTAFIQRECGLMESGRRYAGWLGLESPSVQAAIWMMRALVVSNVLARREGTVLYVPINPVTDPGGQTVAESVAKAHAFATVRGVI